MARVTARAEYEARLDGLKVGIIRPITLWPFPTEVIRRHAESASNFIVVEDTMGQMVEDVKYAVGDKAQVHLIGFLDRHLPTGTGMILPDSVLNRIKAIV